MAITVTAGAAHEGNAASWQVSSDTDYTLASLATALNTAQAGFCRFDAITQTLEVLIKSKAIVITLGKLFITSNSTIILYGNTIAESPRFYIGQNASLRVKGNGNPVDLVFMLNNYKNGTFGFAHFWHPGALIECDVTANSYGRIIASGKGPDNTRLNVEVDNPASVINLVCDAGVLYQNSNYCWPNVVTAQGQLTLSVYASLLAIRPSLATVTFSSVNLTLPSVIADRFEFYTQGIAARPISISKLNPLTRAGVKSEITLNSSTEAGNPEYNFYQTGISRDNAKIFMANGSGTLTGNLYTSLKVKATDPLGLEKLPTFVLYRESFTLNKATPAYTTIPAQSEFNGSVDYAFLDKSVCKKASDAGAIVTIVGHAAAASWETTTFQLSTYLWGYEIAYKTSYPLTKDTGSQSISVTVLPEPSVTSATINDVPATISNAASALDNLRKYSFDNRLHSFGKLTNGWLNMSDYDLVIDPSASQLVKLLFDSGQSKYTCTIKANNFAGNVKTTGTITGKQYVTGSLLDATQSGFITVKDTSGLVVEMRKAGDNTTVKTRTGDGSFAVAPTEEGLSVYFVSLVGTQIKQSTIDAPLTLATGDNGSVSLTNGFPTGIDIAASVWSVSNRGNKLDESAARVIATTS